MNRRDAMSDDDRWHLLVERYIEGTLFPDERARLRRRIESDVDFRDRFVEAVTQEAALRTIGREAAEACGIARNRPPLARVIAARRSRLGLPLAAAAFLVGAFGAAVWHGRTDRPAHTTTPLNPSFEMDKNGDGRPDRWPNGRIRCDRERARDGAASMRIEGPDTPGAFTGQSLRLDPGTRYRVTVWLRTRGVAAGRDRGVRLRFVQTDPVAGELAVSPWLDGTRDWERVAIAFTTPVDHRCGRLDIQWSLGEGETAWADAVSLERIE